MFITEPYNYTLYCIDKVWYKKTGWFGCQLESYQFKFPDFNEHRSILDKTFKMHNVNFTLRFYLLPMWKITWCLVNLSSDIDYANSQIREFYEKLEKV
jgi:hypothetical protein